MAPLRAEPAGSRARGSAAHAPPIFKPSYLQVSELSHKLGSAQGSARALEADVESLRAAAKAAAGDKHDLEIRLADARAKLAALEEKVRGALGVRGKKGAGGCDAARRWPCGPRRGGAGAPACVGRGLCTGPCRGLRPGCCRHGCAPRPTPRPAAPRAARAQSQSQAQVVSQQQARLSDLEGAARQWEERCGELRDALAAHEQVGGGPRARRLRAEVRGGLSWWGPLP